LQDIERRPESPYARIARANLETVSRVGVERVSVVLEDILRDRNASYGRCGLAPPPWSARSGNVAEL
jgi:hypothetical protein